MSAQNILSRYKRLAQKAVAARRFAVAPYSRFRVGAALLTDTGKIVTGCNIESSSYGLTLCAERTAIFKAVSGGNRKFRAIAIAAGSAAFTPPCGACRQVLMDLAGDIDIILVGTKGRLKILRLHSLLPLPFTGKAETHR